MERIKMGTNPNYLFLHYNPQKYKIMDIFLVPKHFITPSIIEKRKPLRENARRHGGVGSNILLGNLPGDALIHIIEDGMSVPKSGVRNQWNKILFSRDQRIDFRGWLADVLACVRELGIIEFQGRGKYKVKRS